ncbi:putative S9C family peptidase [Gemmatirosa kalamazoonensis]|uniref:Putative S9C family peptidase n=1 Tax=Gemmatirosa kalamazoonensis TaxID=861299 RepID=W0RMB7_9BACT|nr:prolyl oligopeptidase family serine peptidase [Gemmatirosa kalamazoonensis]AHG91612.1 putative S9C family peptidase [Gemmatirosa kalamazoonensis]
MRPQHLSRTTLAALCAFAVVASTPLGAQPAAGARQFTSADLKAWRTIRNPTLSNDGRWFAYVLAPNEGDATVVIRPTAEGGKELRFAVGSPPPAATGGGQGIAAVAGAAQAPLLLSGDGQWAAFTVYPTQAETRRARTARRPTYTKVALVNLATGEKRDFDRARRFAFNADRATVLALQGYPAEAAPNATAAANGAANGAAPSSRAEGTDLLLVPLGAGEMVNVGNVGEFDFDDSGEWLAYTIDARDLLGNGVQLRNVRTGVVRALESERALYRRLAWADSAPALAVLRGTVDSVARDTSFAVVSFTGVAAAPKKTVFDSKGRADFPAGLRVAGDRAPRFSEDLQAVYFGIREARAPNARRGGITASLVQPGAPGMGGTVNQPRLGDGSDDETPTLVLWHWKDPRLQSMQIVQEQQDRAYSYLAAFRPAENRFVRVADDSLRAVTTLPHDRWATATDVRAYQQAASYSGRAYADVYAIDLKTGARRPVLRKQASSALIPSPDGTRALYWGDDANWWTIDLATGATRNVTKGAPVSFANTEDDHNNLFPPPQQPFGWTKDGAAVLLSDGWDAWLVPVNGGAATNLTVDGRKNRVRYQRLYSFDAQAQPTRAGRSGTGNAPTIDRRKPLYFATYGEWTKKSGLSRVSVGKPGAVPLVWDDASFAFTKAKDADVYLYTRQSSTEFPNWWIASADLKSGRQLTDANPEQSMFAWSSGVKLVNYVSEKGDSLQGALYLPANYQPGKQYPLLVTIYEKRSQNANVFVQPNETSTPNRSLYTSRGYAVLDPDIVYKVNDPGMSAVWSVVPAVKAAIATGVVDSANVGLWGHSWGGYQTAFLVTQTNIFKSAIAGAPLTDMVSMYSSIYWNTGGTNQAIFEASQGRFKGNYTDNLEAYLRNSPVFHAKNVQTPLVILHNDKDGAVDFNQGITYYNTLRQLGKDVILLEYVGENHGLARPVNQKDYAVRMREWFDAYLKGAPAPDWMKNGVPRLQMAEHLRMRADTTQARTDVVP